MTKSEAHAGVKVICPDGTVGVVTGWRDYSYVWVRVGAHTRSERISDLVKVTT